MDKRSVQQKKGLLTDAEIQKLVTEWQDERGEEDLVSKHEQRARRACLVIGRGSGEEGAEASRGARATTPTK